MGHYIRKVLCDRGTVIFVKTGDILLFTSMIVRLGKTSAIVKRITAFSSWHSSKMQIYIYE